MYFVLTSAVILFRVKKKQLVTFIVTRIILDPV